jgi:hypothetical protein
MGLMKQFISVIFLVMLATCVAGCAFFTDILDTLGVIRTDGQEDEFVSPYTGRPEVVCAYFHYFRTDDFSQWHYPGRDPRRVAGPESWRRQIWIGNADDYPYIGTYDNIRDPEIMRWHIRLAKAAGITAFVVYMFDWKEQERETQLLMDVAAQENFKIGLCEHHSYLGAVPRSLLGGVPHPRQLQKYLGYHQVMDMYADQLGLPRQDEGQSYIRPIPRSLRAIPRDAANQAIDRIAGMVNRWKDHPAYYRVDGKPLIMIPYGDERLLPEDFKQIATGVEAKVGRSLYVVALVPQVYWYFYPAHVPYSGISKDWAEVGASAFTHWTPNGMITAPQRLRIDVTRFNVKDSVKWKKDPMIPLMPGFDDDAWRPGDDPAPTAPRRNGEAWREQLQAAVAARPRFLFIQAWNEWHEGSQIEPSTAYSDPYLYLKLLAGALNHQWHTPPLPPKSSIDPLRVNYLPY